MRGGCGAGCWRGCRRGRFGFGGSGGFFGGVGTARTKDGVFGGDAGLRGGRVSSSFFNWKVGDGEGTYGGGAGGEEEGGVLEPGLRGGKVWHCFVEFERTGRGGGRMGIVRVYLLFEG